MMDHSPQPGDLSTAVKPRKVDPLLYSIYHRGSTLSHFVRRRCRPSGIAIGVVLTLAACLSIGKNSAATYQVFSLCVGMILIGAPWAFLRRASVEGKRRLPRFGTAGEPMSYSVTVWHRGRGKLARAWLSDDPPDPRPRVEDFTTLREPGEEERNPFDRALAYFRWQWLVMTNTLYTGGRSRGEISIPKQEKVEVTMDITPLRRGIVKFQDMRVLLPDPFGLFQRARRIKAPDSTLIVLPRRYPLPNIDLPGGAAFKVSGEANTNSIGTSGEFVGLRDYRPGDPLRQIHWKSWARTGRPIVKELEDTFYPRYGLVVDTLSNHQTDATFEDVVSVAASFAASIDTNESLLDLMFIKNEAHVVTAGRGVERAEKLLEVLAGVTPERAADFDQLARLVIRHKDDLTASLVIFNGWDSDRARFLRKLSENGIICVPMVIGIGERPPGVPGYWLEHGQIGRDLQTLPPRLSSAS